MTQSSFQDTSTIMLRQPAQSADVAEGTLSLRATAANLKDLPAALDSHLNSSQLKRITISFQETPDITVEQIVPVAGKVATWVKDSLKGSEEDKRSACLTDLTPSLASQLKGFRRFMTIDADAEAATQAASPAATRSPDPALNLLKAPVTAITSARDGNTASIQVKDQYHGETETREALVHLGTGLQRIDARLRWSSQQLQFAESLPTILSEKLVPGGLLVVQYEPSPDRAAGFKSLPLVSIEDNSASFQFTGNRLINTDIEISKRLIGKNRDAIGIDLTTISDLQNTEAMNLVLLSSRLSGTGKMEIYFKADSPVEAALNRTSARLRERCTLHPVSE